MATQDGTKRTCSFFEEYIPKIYLFSAPDIPQKAQITYEIELISIANGDDLNQMSVQERLAYG